MTMQLRSAPRASAPGGLLVEAMVKIAHDARNTIVERAAHAQRLRQDETIFPENFSGEIIELDGTLRITPFVKGGLAVWQERRAKTIFEAHIVGGIEIESVARQCSLSVSHFSHAFRASTGTTPHNWLTRRRVARATALMRDSRTSLARMAIESGFADQSHLTRVFKRVTGQNPGAWRRFHSG